MQRLGLVLVTCCVCVWAAAPRAKARKEGAGGSLGAASHGHQYGATSTGERPMSGAPSSAVLDAALRSEFVLEHLKLFASPAVLGAVHMQAVETWTPVRNPGAAKTDHSRIFYYKTVELELPVTDGGVPLSSHALAKQQRAIARAEADINQAWQGASSEGRLIQIDDQIVDIGSLLRDFTWTPVGRSEYLGHACVEFRFAPRLGIHPDSHAERVMATMVGNLWLDPESGQIYKATFHNREAVKFGLGLLASFSFIQGSFEMQPVAGGWVWGRTTVQMRGRELWFDKSGTLVKSYTLAGN